MVENLLLPILEDAREMLARPDNDFRRSYWPNREAALAEIDVLIETARDTNSPNFPAMKMLFAPTGDMQEVSLGSGWAKEFLRLAARFDAAISGA